MFVQPPLRTQRGRARVSGVRAFERLDVRLHLAADIGLRGDYFDASAAVFQPSLALTTPPVLSRRDRTLDFAWGTTNPLPSLLSDQFAVRWTGQIQAPVTGPMALRLTLGPSDQGRLWLDDQLVVDASAPATGPTTSVISVEWLAGQRHNLRLDYVDQGGEALVRLDWDWTQAASPHFQVIPTDAFYPFSPPIRITEPGVYAGSWESLDPEREVVALETSGAVVVTQSVVLGVTASADDSSGLLLWRTGDTDLTVRDTLFQGTTPNVPGAQMARAINLINPHRLTIEHNRIEGTTGIRVLNWDNGNGLHPPAEFVTIRYNEVHNLDGSRTDAQGQRIPWKSRTRLSDGAFEPGSSGGNFVQFDSLLGQPNVEIAWNQIFNEPGLSVVEDTINTYQSGGTAASPFQIHDNYIEGGFLASPARTGTEVQDGYLYQYTPSGSGLQINDNAAGLDAGYIDVYRNQVVGYTNAGITLSGGHHVSLFENRVVSSARLPPTGVARGSWVGMYAWDFYGTGPTRFYANLVRDNVLGWNGANSAGDTFRNDAMFLSPGTDGTPQITPPNGVTWRAQVSLTVDPTTLITVSQERDERTRWLTRLQTAAILPGRLTTLLVGGAAADFDEDQAVDAADALILFGRWGESVLLQQAIDLNRDHVIDAADAEILFAAWTGDATGSDFS